ncbi:MAG: hypothetical protein MUO78_00050 [candidate division Zixibacteria bacterium]|nr:hypothetical protein [candidate division Zixibacteria bacterium]
MTMRNLSKSGPPEIQWIDENSVIKKLYLLRVIKRKHFFHIDFFLSFLLSEKQIKKRRSFSEKWISSTGRLVSG